MRVARSATCYAGLLDAMFHMLSESGADQPAAVIRLLDVLAGLTSIEGDPARRREIRRHVYPSAEAALLGTPDDAARTNNAQRRDHAVSAFA